MSHWTIHLEGDLREDFHRVAVAVGHQVYCFGGGIYPRGNDTVQVYVFSTVSLHGRTLAPGAGDEVPSGREAHTAVLIGDTVYLWGGYLGLGYSNVLHAFDVNSHRWFKPQVSGTVPEGRECHTASALGKVMYIHGGFTAYRWSRPTNDLYKFDTNTMVWTIIHARGTPPPAPVAHSANMIGTKMFIFGGTDRGLTQNFDAIRVFDTETNRWLDTPPAQLPAGGREDHSAFVYKGELYIFGGRSFNLKLLNDVWKFHPETFTWKKLEPQGNGPPPMRWMACCMMGDRVILFGGTDREDGRCRSSNDLYMLDFSPSLETLCKLGVIRYGLRYSALPRHIRRELTAMTSDTNVTLKTSTPGRCPSVQTL